MYYVSVWAESPGPILHLSLGGPDLFRGASLVAQPQRTCLPKQETWEMGVRSLGQEDPLEKGMATHSNILVWEIPWSEEPGRLQSVGFARVGHDLASIQKLVYFLE